MVKTKQVPTQSIVGSFFVPSHYYRWGIFGYILDLIQDILDLIQTGFLKHQYGWWGIFASKNVGFSYPRSEKTVFWPMEGRRVMYGRVTSWVKVQISWVKVQITLVKVQISLVKVQISLVKVQIFGFQKVVPSHQVSVADQKARYKMGFGCRSFFYGGPGIPYKILQLAENKWDICVFFTTNRRYNPKTCNWFLGPLL